MTQTEHNLEINSEVTEEQETVDLHQNGDEISSEETLNIETKPLVNEEEENMEVTSVSESDASELEEDLENKAEKTIQEESITSDEGETSTPSSSINQEIIEDLQKQIVSLKEELAAEAAQNTNNQSQYLRIVADFENFRRRTAKEKEELEQQIKKRTLSELLSVVDNFERARTQIKPANDGEMGIHKSYQGVYKNLVDSLKKIGVSAMRPEGSPFDPNYHEAMLREPTNEYEEGIVIEQLVRGYLLNEDVLRHAMVRVAAAPEDSSEDNSESSTESSENNIN